MRRFHYRAGYLLRFSAWAIIQPWLESLLDWFGRQASFEGIKIVAPPGRSSESETPFLRYTTDTLRLIQSANSRRFRRKRREFAVIENIPSLSMGSYSRPGRRCRIDFARYDAESWKLYPEWYQWMYATLLVHEATHGAVCSRHVHYTGKTRARIERLCCEEARRFARRADREDRQWSDTLVPPFDEKTGTRAWQRTWWQQTKGRFARLREVVAKEKEKDG